MTRRGVTGDKLQVSLAGTFFHINEINGLTDSISCFVNEWAMFNVARAVPRLRIQGVSRQIEFTLAPERVCKSNRCLGGQSECANLIERDTL